MERGMLLKFLKLKWSTRPMGLQKFKGLENFAIFVTLLTKISVMIMTSVVMGHFDMIFSNALAQTSKQTTAPIARPTVQQAVQPIVSASSVDNNYYCSINMLPPKVDIPTSKLSLYAHPFIFENSGEGAGVKTKFKDYEVILWNQNKSINLILKDFSKKLEIATKGDNPFLKLKNGNNPDVQVECLTQTKWELLNNDTLKLLFPVPLNDSSNLLYYSQRFTVQVNRDLMFPYESGDREVEGMQEIYFQDGRAITSDQKDSKDNKKNWCIFQMRRLVNQEVVVPSGTEIPVISFNVLRNNKDHFIVNYNFVDFNTGLKGFQTKEFAPFTLKCKINNGTIFSYKLFKEITAKYFQFGVTSL